MEPTRLKKQMHLDDAAAVAQARGGDEEAFRVLVERHGRSIYRLAYRMTGRPEDAEDVVQETFVRAYRQLSRFEARSNFATWLYRIGFNCAIDYMRARPHRESAESHETLERSHDRHLAQLLAEAGVRSAREQTLGEELEQQLLRPANEVPERVEGRRIQRKARLALIVAIDARKRDVGLPRARSAPAGSLRRYNS